MIPAAERTASALTAAAVLLGVTVLVTAQLTPGYDHRYDTVSRPLSVERRRSAASLTLIVIAATAFPLTWGSMTYGLLQRIILVTALALADHHSPTQPATRPDAELLTPSSWSPGLTSHRSECRACSRAARTNGDP